MAFSNLLVWSRVYSSRLDELAVYFLDVGQGDSIFIESPTGNRVLIDGGPDRKVLSELGEILPFGDKRIDVVIETHPDADHITGLVEVLRRFEVGAFISSGVDSPNEIDDLMDKILEEKDIKRLQAKRGMKLDLGDGATLTILFPNQDVSSWETNEASVVSRLEYGESSFLLTGDSTKRAEYILLSSNDKLLDTDVMQVGHHGSETSTAVPYVKAVSPEIAVISSGKNNRYGHPHQVTLDTLSKFGTTILNTALVGRIKFESDGESIFVD